ncbi:MAG: hypothetical protein AB7S26_17660 [Sandaracinaceae bacterium]
MRTLLRNTLLVLPLLLTHACAEGGNFDAGTGTRDADGRDAGGGGGRDGGSAMCPTGRHVCGGGCVDDLPNMPENGCRIGCGTACDTPTGGRARCNTDGTCGFVCDPPFVESDGTCACAPQTCEDLGATCGTPDDGCGTPLSCGMCGAGAECIMGACACPPDDAEPNDEQLRAVDIGDATDAPDTTLTFDTYSIDEAGDVDWFTIDVSDDFDAGNPAVRVTLDGVPSGDNYELEVYYACGGGSDESSCLVAAPCSNTATPSRSAVVNVSTECGGTTDESGRLYLIVRATSFGGMCAPYSLRVEVT